MAVANRGRAELCSSPERTKVWTETTAAKKKKVSVVYYLSRNGQLEQPHFMEVTLSSRDGLYLKDVIKRLNFLRGNGMASLYSWSSKRSYKNGFVWHDLCEDDFIYPAHGQEYVLKGSELLRETTNHSPGEYKVYAETSAKAMEDAATQTEEEERRRRRRRVLGENELEEEVSCDEISPPPSSSSTETLESLIKAEGGGGIVKSGGGGGAGGEEMERLVGGCSSGRFRASASAVLMNLISCGSVSVKNGGGGGGGGGCSLPPRAQGGYEDRKEMDGAIEMPSFSAIRLEEKEYFSGSLIETKKKTLNGDRTAALKRSSSYNAERSSKMEMDGGRGATCIPAGKTK